MSRRDPITADDVTRVFDDEWVRNLCQHHYLPRGVDVLRFSEGVRSAAYAYAEDVRARSGDEIRAEIAELLKFANFSGPTGRTTGVKYEKVARKLEHMSREATRLLTDRSERISWRPEPSGPPVTAIGRNGEILTRKCRDGFSVTLPSPADLRDQSRRERACEIIRLLCSNGVRPTIEGQAVKYDVYAPQIIYEERPNETGDASQRDLIRKRRPKRKAELEFVSALRMVWLMATGTRASRTGSWHHPGPFVQFTAACLTLIRAYHEDNADAGAEKLINECDQRRRKVESRCR